MQMGVWKLLDCLHRHRARPALWALSKCKPGLIFATKFLKRIHMGGMTGLKLAGVWFLALVLAIVIFLFLSQDGRRKGELRQADVGKVPIGMLGDSDTSAYQDHVSFPSTGEQPGGSFHPITLQWPEVLARLRPSQVDLGEWAVWGLPRWASLARLRDGLRLPWRGPRRETHQNNLAWWGSGCDSLTHGSWRQAQRLVDVMDEQPMRWQSGVVVIRSGVNSFGKEAELAALALDPDDPTVTSKMTACIGEVRGAVALIHESHPATRIVLVGIFNNADWAPFLPRWQSKLEQANLNRGLDHFDNALRSMALTDPRLAFFDDRAWFARHWGQRDPETGLPNYRPVQIGNVLSVANTTGDNPENATLANLHAGLVWNLLWSQDLVQLIRTRFASRIDAVTDDEVADYLRTALAEMSSRSAFKP